MLIADSIILERQVLLEDPQLVDYKVVFQNSNLELKVGKVRFKIYM
jgi:hypothetical protein